jgi:hypothetical protein
MSCLQTLKDQKRAETRITEHCSISRLPGKMSQQTYFTTSCYGFILFIKAKARIVIGHNLWEVLES